MSQDTGTIPEYCAHGSGILRVRQTRGISRRNSQTNMYTTDTQVTLRWVSEPGTRSGEQRRRVDVNHEHNAIYFPSLPESLTRRFVSTPRNAVTQSDTLGASVPVAHIPKVWVPADSLCSKKDVVYSSLKYMKDMGENLVACNSSRKGSIGYSVRIRMLIYERCYEILFFCKAT